MRNGNVGRALAMSVELLDTTMPEAFTVSLCSYIYKNTAPPPWLKLGSAGILSLVTGKFLHRNQQSEKFYVSGTVL